MPRLYRPVLAFVACLCVAVGAETAWPELPDPVGLGPRLATIEWLRDRGVKVAAGTADAAILALYQQHSPEAKAAAAQQVVAAAAAEEADRRATLRAEITRRFGVQPPADATLEELRKQYKEAETQQMLENGRRISEADQDKPARTEDDPAPAQPPAQDVAKPKPPSQRLPDSEAEVDRLKQTCKLAGGMSMRCRVWYRPTAEDPKRADVFLANEDKEIAYAITSGYLRFADGKKGFLCLVDPACTCGNARLHATPRVIGPRQVVKIGTVPLDGTVTVHDMAAEPAPR